MILQKAIDASKALGDLEREAKAVLMDSSKEMRMVSSPAELLHIVSQARKSESTLVGIQTQMYRALAPCLPR